MVNAVKWFVLTVIPHSWRPTLFLRLFGLSKVLMIWWVRARIITYTPERVQVLIPLTRRTRNHLKSMYFGALAAGADCAGGVVAVAKIYQDNLPIDFVFKDFEAKFLKRPDGDVVFTCDDAPLLDDAVKEAQTTKERVNIALSIKATVPSKYAEEVVADFKLTLSLKWRGK